MQMKKLYFLLSALLMSFIANAETLTVNISYEDDDYNETYADDITVDATINDGVVTIADFLGSGKSITFTAYDDESATIDWSNSTISGSFTFSTFGTYSQLYIYVPSYTYVYYYEGSDEEYGDYKYLYLGIFAISANYDYDWYNVYINLPDSFKPKAAAKTYEATETAKIYELVNGAETGDAISETISYKLTGNTLALTDVFGRTDYSAYLKYELSADGTSYCQHEYANNNNVAGWYTTTWTFNGVDYKRLYDYASSYDVAKQEFVWDFYFSPTADHNDLTSTYRAHLPLPTEYSAGVNSVVVDNDENAPVEYFNLQGIRVANPENGLYIRRQGNKATKVIIR
jgi:hypothetical protein